MIRNEEGVKVAAKNGILYGVLDPPMAEAMSCRKVLSWLKSLNIIKVIVEFDTLQVINAM